MVYDSTPLTPEILDVVVRHWGVEAAEDAERLHGGEESSAYRVGGHVIRIGPGWRSDAELEWSHEIATRAAEKVPEAVAPSRTRSGVTVIRAEGRPVSVWPYRSGAWADDEDDATWSQAADLLARLHRALADLSMPPRPGPGPLYAEAPDLDDPALDAWLQRFDATHPRQPLHGDFYRGNMLVEEGRIVALLDWDETLLGPVERELAWAVWEWCDGVLSLDLEEAHDFIGVYQEGRGVTGPVDDVMLRQLIRERLRREVRYSRAAHLRGVLLDEDDNEYEARQIEAFSILRPDEAELVW